MTGAARESGEPAKPIARRRDRKANDPSTIVGKASAPVHGGEGARPGPGSSD